VRVHHDALADQSARAVNANAYTVGRDIVFAHGKYDPASSSGRRLIAHELAHVVQQGQDDSRSAPLSIAPPSSVHETEADAAASRAVAPAQHRAAPAVQRQPAPTVDEPKKEGPQAAATPSPMNLQLHLDPAIQAQILAMQAQMLLDPARVRLSLEQIDYASLLGSAPPPWLTTPKPGTPGDVMPRAAGPETPRPAAASDVLQALMKVPAVDRALTSIKTDATDRLKSDWRGLTTGEKALVITHTAVLGGGAAAAALSNPEGRQFALDILQNKSLPTGVPGLKFQFNLTGPDQRVMFQLNVGQFLPQQWGFH
jgi:hypothetical protein